jgi:hypothetical protein
VADRFGASRHLDLVAPVPLSKVGQDLLSFVTRTRRSRCVRVASVWFRLSFWSWELPVISTTEHRRLLFLNLLKPLCWSTLVSSSS